LHIIITRRKYLNFTELHEVTETFKALFTLLEMNPFLEVISQRKVPETITHKKRLNVKQGAMAEFEEFLDKISPLKNSNKLGAVLIQLPPSFTVNDFRNIEGFLDRLPSSSTSSSAGYDYAVEFIVDY
jgi:hypothetical protein